MDFLGGLGIALLLVAQTALLAVLMRRLLGVPVGWLRGFAVAAAVMLLGGPAMSAVGVDLGIVTPDGQVAPGSSLWGLSVVLALVAAWGVAIGLGVLLVLEVVVPSRSTPGPISVARGLPAQARRNRRYVAITGIAARHGLGGFLRPGPATVEDTPRVARALRLALTDGGVTFVKLGQMLATRPDLVGQDFAEELGRLQADVAPEPWNALREVVEAETGRRLPEVFAHVDPEPLAAASVGQVHAATLLDGTPVVVKVQRPGAQAQTRADLDIIERLAHRLATGTTWGRRLDVQGLARGFSVSIAEELDYRTEAENARAIRLTLPSTSQVRVPRMFAELSGRRILVMERMDGVPLSRADTELGRYSAAERRAMADDLLEVVLRQIIETGVFHADLHGGNVLLAPDGALVLLDLGSVGRLDSATRASLTRLLLAFEMDDAVAATDAMLGLLDRPGGLDDRELERALGALVTRHRIGGSSGALFSDLLRLVVDRGFQIPPQLAAAFRALGALEGTLRRLDPDLDLVTAARRLGTDLGRERLRPEAVKDELTMQLARLVPVLERLPRRVDALARQAEHGELTVRLRALDDPADREFVSGLVHQVTTSIIALACSVIALGLLVAPGGPELLPPLRALPVLGATFLLVAFALAARVLAEAFHRRR